MTPSAAPPRQRRPLPRLLALSVAAIVAYTAGMGWFQYHLLFRASEDAYATMLLRRATTASTQIQELLAWLLSDLASLGHPALADTSQPAGELLNNLRAKYGPLLLAAAAYDAQGQRTALSAPAEWADAFPAELFRDFADEAWLKGKSRPWLLEAPIARNSGPVLYVVAPIVSGSDWRGAAGAAISLAALEKQFLAGLRDSDSVLCWLSGTNRVLAGTTPVNQPPSLRPAETRELILEDNVPDTPPYTVMEVEGVRRLTVYAPVNLPDRKWTVGLSMLWNTVRLAPHALFKSAVILAAWALPLIAILVLFSLRALLLAVITRERLLLRHELDEAQSKLLALIEAVPEAVCLSEPAPAGNMIFISHRIEAFTGHAALELMTDPKSWSRLIHPEDRDAVARNRQRVIQDRRAVTFSFRLKHRSSDWIAVTECATPVLDSSGQPTHLLSVLSRATDSPPPKQTPSPSQPPDQTDRPDPADPSPRANHDARSTISSAPKARVLLVDDDRLLVSLFSKALERAGYGITGAYNGLQAIELFTARPESFDVIVLDMVMPKMSGLEAIQHLRKIRPDVRIIGISGYSTDGKEWDLPRQGAQAFLSKPFEAEDLAKIIDSLIAGRPDRKDNPCS